MNRGQVPCILDVRELGSPSAKRVFVGTSGYNYPHWRNGVFYPSDLPQKRWLEFYCEHFDTVELNVTFYRLPSREVFEGWYRRTPKTFLFALKGSRFVTHIKRLKGCREPLALFLDRAGPLKEKLGVILWQLPPRFRFDKERFEAFGALLSTLPRSKTLRHAFEFRDPSWFCGEAFALLRTFGFAFCIAHGAGFPMAEEISADFVYLRLHGGAILYGSNYSKEELQEWVGKIAKWRKEGKTVFVYFNNDAFGFAVQNALKLKSLLTGGEPDGIPVLS